MLSEICQRGNLRILGLTQKYRYGISILPYLTVYYLNLALPNCILSEFCQRGNFRVFSKYMVGVLIVISL